MLKCKEAVKISSSETRPSLLQRIELFFHFMMCQPCRNYVKQLNILKSEIKKIYGLISSSNYDQGLEDLKKKIIQKINKES